MSWPDFGPQRPAKSPRPDFPGLRRNHPLAETAESEASVGRHMGTARLHNKTLD